MREEVQAHEVTVERDTAFDRLGDPPCGWQPLVWKGKAAVDRVLAALGVNPFAYPQGPTSK